MKNSINERIHDLRERSGLTQTDLAIRLGVTRSCVNAWEMGVSRPSLDNVLSLGHIFHTTTDYLLGFDNKETLLVEGYSVEEKELLMRLIHYIEEQHEEAAKNKNKRL